MPADPLADPIWTALSTSHRHLAQTLGGASRYPASVAPFAALARQPAQSSDPAGAPEQLRQLLAPGEDIFVAGDRPVDVPGLRWTGTIPCSQMIFPAVAPLPEPIPGITVQPLDCTDAPEMMDLIAIAYPGFFRPETCRMGRYFGVRDTGGQLIAMGGERLCLHVPGQRPWREISAVCSHPEHAGRHLGTAVLREILATQRASGAASWLWVAETNQKAMLLYLRLGFQQVRRTELHGLQRSPE